MSESVLRILIFIMAALFFSALAFCVKKKKNIMAVLWVAGELTALLLVINNFVLNQYVPFVSIYQLLTFCAFLFGVAYLYVAFVKKKDWTALYFICCSLIVSIGLCFMDIQAKWSFPPALQSPWFVPHVLVYMISYIFAAVAGAMVLSKLLVKDKKRIDGGVYELVSLLFPMMTMGMLMGAIWANEVWGGFWSFDIKECWSLVTWLTYALYLHVRRSTRFNKYKDILVLLGLVFVIITFLFVNGMAGAASSQHTYG